MDAPAAAPQLTRAETKADKAAPKSDPKVKAQLGALIAGTPPTAAKATKAPSAATESTDRTVTVVPGDAKLTVLVNENSRRPGSMAARAFAPYARQAGR